MIIVQEVNEMWAGLGYYRRARFLLEVLPHDNWLVFSSPSPVYLLLDPTSYPNGQFEIVFEIVNYGVKPSSLCCFCLLSNASKSHSSWTGYCKHRLSEAFHVKIFDVLLKYSVSAFDIREKTFNLILLCNDNENEIPTWRK